MLPDTISSDALQNKNPKEDTQPHLAIQSDTYIDDTNKTIKDDKYPWLDKDDKRGKISDRRIKYKIQIKDSKLTKI